MGSESSPMVAVVLTGGLDRGASAFPRVELTHALAVSNLYRAMMRGSLLPTCRAALGSIELGVSAIVPRGRNCKEEARRNFSREGRRGRGGGEMLSLEGAWSLITEELLTLSEQQFEDCDTVDSACTVDSWTRGLRLPRRTPRFLHDRFRL